MSIMCYRSIMQLPCILLEYALTASFLSIIIQYQLTDSRHKPIFPPQNDPGSSPTTGAKHFTTYMKARIYCEREVPSGREFVGALDYQYNDMSEYSSDLVFPSSKLVTINNTVCGLNTARE